MNDVETESRGLSDLKSPIRSVTELVLGPGSSSAASSSPQSKEASLLSSAGSAHRLLSPRLPGLDAPSL